jgi:hypothetical protein
VDRETRRWLAVFGVTFVISIVVGWFLPDGLNELAGLVGEPKVAVSPLTRFFCLALLFLILAGIDFMLWLRGQARKTNLDITTSLSRGLADYGSEIAEGILIRSLLPYRARTPAQAADGARVMKIFGDLLGGIPPDLLPGYSVFVEDRLSRVADDLRDLANGRVRVNIEQHLQINRRFAAIAGSYTHINRRAYNAPDDWTEEWRSMVTEFGDGGFSPEYLVLMTEDDLTHNAEKIRRMYSYLHDCGWSLRCCALEQVKDTIGNEIPTDANVDVYSGVAAKLHWIPVAGYRGAAALDIRLVQLDAEPKLRGFVNVVRRFAWVPDPATGGRPTIALD